MIKFDDLFDDYDHKTIFENRKKIIELLEEAIVEFEKIKLKNNN